MKHEVSKEECPSCDKLFASKQRLKGHIATVHEGKKLSKLNCDVCKTSFASKKQLKSHNCTIHGKNVPEVHEVVIDFDNAGIFEVPEV